MKKMDLMKFIVYLDWPSSEEAAWKSERTEKTKNKKNRKQKILTKENGRRIG